MFQKTCIVFIFYVLVKEIIKYSKQESTSPHLELGIVQLPQHHSNTTLSCLPKA